MCVRVWFPPALGRFATFGDGARNGVFIPTLGSWCLRSVVPNERVIVTGMALIPKEMKSSRDSLNCPNWLLSLKFCLHD